MNQLKHGAQPFPLLEVTVIPLVPTPPEALGLVPHKYFNLIVRAGNISEKLKGASIPPISDLVSDKTPVPAAHIDEHDEADFFMT
jgi:hypothetical protein